MTTLPPDYINYWLMYAKNLKEKEIQREALAQMITEAEEAGLYELGGEDR